MHRMDDAAFQAWLAEGGIANTARNPGTRYLEFPRPGGLSSTWPAPDPPELAPWLRAVVRAASPDGPWWLRRRYPGGWWAGDVTHPVPQALDAAVSAAGVPRDFVGALGFDAAGREAMLGIVDAFATWDAGLMWEDLFIVPADRSCVVMLCHDEEIHAYFRDPARRDAFDAAMREATNGDR